MKLDKLLKLDELLNTKLIETLENLNSKEQDAQQVITIAIQLDNMRKTNIDKIYQIQDWNQTLENVKTK